MSLLLELRRQKAIHVDRYAEILSKANDEHREPSEEETAELAKCRQSVDDLRPKIEQQEWIESQRAGLSAPIHMGGTRQSIGDRVRASVHGKLKAFTGPTAKEDAFKCGMWLAASIFANPEAQAFCREHGIAIERAAAEGTNAAGGFLVPEQFLAAIIDLREAYGVFRRECRVIPMTRDAVTIPRRIGGLTAYAVGENDEITESEKQWAQVALVARKWAVLTRMSSEISEDAAIAMADDLAQEVAYAFAVSEDTAGFNGDGTSTHHGIVGIRVELIDGNHAASVHTAAAGHDLYADIDEADLSGPMGLLPEYVLEPKWYTSRVGWANMFQRLAQAAGGTTMSETIQGPARMMYMGYEVVTSPTFPKVLTTIPGQVMALFGDLSLSTVMGDRRAVTIASSEHRYFELDQLAIRGTQRIDVNNHSLGDGTNAGPVIALVAGSA